MDLKGQRQLKVRNHYIDELRGIAIIFVVLGHAIQYCFGSPLHPVHQIIQTFQMPLLFLISGYVSGLSKHAKFRTAVINKVERLLVPYICWAQITYIGGVVRNHNYSIQSQIYSIVNSGFWFLRILFLLSIVFLIGKWTYLQLKKRCGQLLKITLSVILSLVLCVIIGCIPGQDSILHYAPFFGLGLIMEIMKDNSIVKRLYSSCLLQVAILVLFVIFVILFLNGDTLINKIADLLLSIVGPFAIGIVIYWLFKGGQCKVLETIGKNTLGIYSVHWVLCMSFGIVPMGVLSHLNFNLQVAIVLLIWSVVCLVIISLLKRNNITSLMLLGEKRGNRSASGVITQ